MNFKKIFVMLLCACTPSKKLRKKIRDKFYGRDIVKTLYHDNLGKIYLPLYNLDSTISSEEPEIYNKNGEKLRTFFIRDLQNAHNPNINSKYFQLDRFNFGLKTHFYTHQAILETMGNPEKKYGFLIESKAIVPEDYKIFNKHKGLDKDFDLIFTSDADILNKHDNARLFIYFAAPWYGTIGGGGVLNPKAYENKSKNVSICSSNKVLCDLNVKRIEVAKYLKNNNLADTFGTFDGGNFVKIAETLTDYRYSIIMENSIEPYFFTQKLTDCFASMTIPIYLGATEIGKFFNPDGIIQITLKDLDNMENILKQCTKEEYEARIPAIIDNYDRVQKYLNVWDKLYEDYFINN